MHANKKRHFIPLATRGTYGFCSNSQLQTMGIIRKEPGHPVARKREEI
jgi:hypothetical protein